MVRIAEAALINLLSKSKLHTMMYRCTGLMKGGIREEAGRVELTLATSFGRETARGTKRDSSLPDKVDSEIAQY